MSLSLSLSLVLPFFSSARRSSGVARRREGAAPVPPCGFSGADPSFGGPRNSLVIAKGGGGGGGGGTGCRETCLAEPATEIEENL